VNFRQISTVTGISRATIYRRWKSRRELLKTTLESATTSVARDPSALLSRPSLELLRFLEDKIGLGLMNPVVPTLVTKRIGASSSHPELLATWCHRTLEPGRRALSQTIARARMEGAIASPPDPEPLRDLLAGALHRLLSRTQAPKEEAERICVKRLIHQKGLDL
jgi:AcrR family transcriptional regulator